MVFSPVRRVLTARALVSAIVVSYNQEPFVRQALESVRAQGLDDLDLVIIDDASSDSSWRVSDTWLKETGFPGRLIRHDRNLGPAAALNTALSHTAGKYVAFLAADDIWDPQKLAGQTELLESSNLEVAATYSDAYIINELGERLPGTFISAESEWAAPPDGDIFPFLVQTNFIPGASTLVRRECIDDVGGFDGRFAAEDWVFWLRLAAKYRFAYSPRPSASYRIVGSSLMRQLPHAALLKDMLRFYPELLGTRPALDPGIRTKMASLALDLYRGGDPEAIPYLRQGLRSRPSLRGAVFLAAASLGVGYETLRPFLRARSP